MEYHEDRRTEELDDLLFDDFSLNLDEIEEAQIHLDTKVDVQIIDVPLNSRVLNLYCLNVTEEVSDKLNILKEYQGKMIIFPYLSVINNPRRLKKFVERYGFRSETIDYVDIPKEGYSAYKILSYFLSEEGGLV